MARLIDADKLAITYCKIDSEYQDEPWLLSDILGCLNDSPTVDAVEVVHGHWIDRYGGKYANPLYECSKCKNKAPYEFKYDLLHTGIWEQALTDYCSHCNAKMDEEATDENS